MEKGKKKVMSFTRDMKAKFKAKNLVLTYMHNLYVISSNILHKEVEEVVPFCHTNTIQMVHLSGTHPFPCKADLWTQSNTENNSNPNPCTAIFAKTGTR